MLYDVFISHASEDKDAFVRPLAERLRQSRVEVWYDEFTLRAGDSLRRSIDVGLAKSRFGIVVLSPSFFAKGWPQWELDGLVHRQVSGGKKVIVPVWHDLGRHDVETYSHALADKVAIPSNLGVEEVTRRVLEVVRPEGSTLLAARDTLIDYGWEPPVITDDWWLDVLEERSDRAFARLCFRLLYDFEPPSKRGAALAWAAMQHLWQDAADEQRISQLTHPTEALAFIDEQPGLREVCEKQPSRVLYFLPQLGVPGFGGYLETAFDHALAESEEEHRKSAPLNPGRPGCDQELALRHPAFCGWAASSIACAFGQGPGDGIGPSARFFDLIDYAVWFLSAKSDWLPRRHHAFLLKGMKDWAAWLWMKGERSYTGFADEAETGAMFDLLYPLREKRKAFSLSLLTLKARTDLMQRLSFSAQTLKLPERGDELADRFLQAGFVEAWLDQPRRIEARRRAMKRLSPKPQGKSPSRPSAPVRTPNARSRH